MRPRALAGLLIFALICLMSDHAFADKRVALLIGNSAYQHVPKLPNPERDAEAIAALLKHAGFDSVEVDSNLPIGDMRRVVRDFSEQARDADIAVIYFAGHGLEAGGVNYLVPVDASLRRDIDVEDEAVPLDRLLQVTEQTKRLRLVILDACRDNPFANSMRRTMASRAVGRGLARVVPSTSNTLVAFAARAGSTAADGDGPHSPFTTALLKNPGAPNLDIRLALGRVRDEVLRATAGKEEPFVYGSLGGDAVTLASLSTQDRQDPAVQADPDLLASRDYEAAAKIGTKEALNSFLKKYPAGFYSDLARSQRAKLLSPDSSKDKLKAGAQKPEQPPEAKQDIGSGRRYSAAENAQCCAAGFTATSDLRAYKSRPLAPMHRASTCADASDEEPAESDDSSP